MWKERQHNANPTGALTLPGIGGAAFLNQKSWHPLSYRNQKALYEAEAAAAKRADADAKAKEEFEAEAEYFKCASLFSLPIHAQRRPNSAALTRS